ncbi:uncharacterized protein N7496_005825 [Penicillium cataractarum]|uniref:Zn(2)-C6 fungal-type domain-containing protein n=1 Tax=Penicillium cataractarum TaxID=2100454 RepID=A0A9W9S528_9EURO|nr:uncharacterized protein N7496_005825 [Penicillium cataractarum]KAJ5369733.1 hypothetical protein N7496_005825 [Penicillium cataractarum]
MNGFINAPYARKLTTAGPSDILTRHYDLHHKAREDGLPRKVKGKRQRRADRACESCASSKLKCDNNRPCTRCEQAARPCVEQQPETATIPVPDIIPVNGSAIHIPHSRDDAHLDTSQPMGFDNEAATPTEVLPSTNGTLSSVEEWQLLGHEGWAYPAYFKHIVTPSSSTPVFSEFPFETLNYMQGTQTDMSLDSFNFLDFTFETNSDMTKDLQPQSYQGMESMDPFGPGSAVSQQVEKDRHPWRWVPNSDQHTFTNRSQIAIDKNIVDQAASSPNTANLPRIIVNDVITPGVRDDLLQFISRITKSEVSILAFPDPNFLDALIKIGFTKRGNRDNWIHPGTICYRNMRPELLTALTVAGCVCFGIPAICKAGLILQEVARLSLDRLFETENHVVRDLQYLQAYMLWVDIGMTCGYPRKMEIAESRFPQLCTALRRAGAFDTSMYNTITPTPQDDEETLENKWKEWARQESFKRLAYSALEHDMQVAMVFNRNPTTSFSEFTAPLPSASEEWFASSADDWRKAYLNNSHDNEDESSLKQLLARLSMLNNLSSGLDHSKAKSVILHGLAGQVFEYQKQVSLFCGRHSHRSANLQLAIRAQQQDLYQSLLTLQDTPETCPERTLMKEFLALSLHVKIEDIERFAGKHGAVEARRIYSLLEAWFEDTQSRHAVWHAGQVLRASRYVQQLQFRGYEAIMIYHATLVLWVYGILHCAHIKHTITSVSIHRDRSRSSQHQTPPQGNSFPQAVIYLDGPSTEETARFLESGYGCPGLKFWDSDSPIIEGDEEHVAFSDLRISHMVMSVGRFALESNYPVTIDNQRVLPPLVHRLCDIMNDLGALSTINI